MSWDSPSNRGGSRILGYILEKRKKGSNLWTVVNAMDELIKGLHFYLTVVQSAGVGDLNTDVCRLSEMNSREEICSERCCGRYGI